MKNLKTILKKTILSVTAVSLATGLTAGLAGCGTSTQSTQGRSTGSEKQVLRIGVGGSEESGYVLELAALANKNGYLEEELNAAGYTVQFVPFASAGPEINEALASGAVDAAIYGDFPAFTSKSNGIDTTVVATVNE